MYSITVDSPTGVRARCHGCKKMLDADFFGTYVNKEGIRKQRRRCLVCRSTEFHGDFGYPGAGKLMCAVCSEPLNLHPLGSWCL